MLSVTFGKYTPAHSRNIASMDIQYKVGDAPDLQSGGGTAGAGGNKIHRKRRTSSQRNRFLSVRSSSVQSYAQDQ